MPKKFPIDLDRLKKVIKETLSPEEYQTWEENCRQDDGDRSCLIANFFKDQQSLPPHLRKDYCHISCPCPRCTPRML
jgi:hypothetical protein